MRERQRTTPPITDETRASCLRTDKEVLVFLAGTDNVSQRAIARVLGVSQPTVSKRLREAGISVTPILRRRVQDAAPTVISLTQQGEPVASTANSLNIAPRSVARVIEQAREQGKLPQTPRSSAGRRNPGEMQDLRILIAKELRDKATYQDIADKFGLTRVRVTQIVRTIRRQGL